MGNYIRTGDIYDLVSVRDELQQFRRLFDSILGTRAQVSIARGGGQIRMSKSHVPGVFLDLVSLRRELNDQNSRIDALASLLGYNSSEIDAVVTAKKLASNGERDGLPRERVKELVNKALASRGGKDG